MIEKFRVKNFKAFQNTGDIELKPMTVIAGPNSSGKTSILQSLLLLKQTLESKDPSVVLDLNGEFMQLTSLTELAFGKPPSRSSRIEYAFTQVTDIPVESAAKYFSNLPVSGERERLPLRSDVEFSFRCSTDPEGKRKIDILKFDMQTHINGSAGPTLSLKYNDKGVKVNMSGRGVRVVDTKRDGKIVAIAGRHFIPSLLILAKPNKVPEDRPQQREVWLDQIFSIPLRELVEDLERNVKYLGPLREEPKPAYLHSGTSSTEIGKRGELAAQILWIERDSQVLYRGHIHGKTESTSLGAAVNDTFRRFNIADMINVKSEEAVTYQILFPLKGHGDKKHLTIADVGFGVSQLLPIVVLGLRSPSSSVLLFEQPEIHLHPKLQANLADFLLAVALTGKRVVVETHSDHFINRLRRRIAEDPSDELKDKINILFVSPPHDGEGARLDQLKVDRYGIVENWPPDFLPEAADEAEKIIRAGLTKRSTG